MRVPVTIVWLGAVLTALLAAGCGSGVRTSVAEAGDEAQDDTTLGTGDLFDVRVYGEDDLSTDYRVAEDGTIDFPLIGRVEVAGMEPPQVAHAIETRLRDGEFLRDPQVSVLVREYNSKRISVIGAVRSPGNFPFRSGLTAVESISLAGGFTSLANRDGTIVTRRVNGEIRRLRVPIDRVSTGQEPDLRLRAGDIVHVPERIF